MDTGARATATCRRLKVFLVGDGYSASQFQKTNEPIARAASAAQWLNRLRLGRCGIAANYTTQDNFGNDAADNRHSIQLGAYGGIGIAGGFVQGYAGYGWDKHKIERAGVVEDMDADPKGNHFIAGAKGGYLMPLGSVRVGPVIALDYAKAKVDGYTEDGDPALTLDVDSISYKSLRGSAGVEVRGDFGGGGVQLRPYAAAVVEKDFTGDARTVHFAQTSAPTIVNSFAFADASKKAYARVTRGSALRSSPNVSLDAGGSTTIGKNQGDETSAQLGVRVGFKGQRRCSSHRLVPQALLKNPARTVGRRTTSDGRPADRNIERAWRRRLPPRRVPMSPGATTARQWTARAVGIRNRCDGNRGEPAIAGETQRRLPAGGRRRKRLKINSLVPRAGAALDRKGGRSAGRTRRCGPLHENSSSARRLLVAARLSETASAAAALAGAARPDADGIAHQLVGRPTLVGDRIGLATGQRNRAKDKGVASQLYTCRPTRFRAGGSARAMRPMLVAAPLLARLNHVRAQGKSHLP